MSNKSKTIVITGAESTGKSILSQWLASWFKAPFLTEFAREYVQGLDQPYNYKNVEFIARTQVEQLSRLQSEGHPLIFVDTWLIITKVWFKEVFDQVPDWLEIKIKQGQIDLFLVCDINLPWIPDLVRENGGERREYLQNCYMKEIESYGFKYRIVKGEGDARYRNAVNILIQEGMVKPTDI